MRCADPEILRCPKDTDLPTYAQPDGNPTPESIYFTTPVSPLWMLLVVPWPHL